MDGQLKVTDLVPRQRSTLIVLFACALAIVSGLEALYAYMPRLAHMTTDGRVAALDLDGEGSLAVWFSTASLELASLLSLLTWSIRRRLLGAQRHRVFLAAALCWLVMSIDECGSVHEAFKELMSHSTGHRLLGDGSIWWVVCYSLVLATIGLLLLREFRAVPEAAAALFSAGGFYALAVVAELEWIIHGKGTTSVMLEEGCEMIGNLCVLLSMAFAARWASTSAQQREATAPGRLPFAMPRSNRQRASA